MCSRQQFRYKLHITCKLSTAFRKQIYSCISLWHTRSRILLFILLWNS